MSSFKNYFVETFDFSKYNSFKCKWAVVLIGVFTFLFLQTEYIFVEVISKLLSSNKTVIFQNYALGISAIGFLSYPIFKKYFVKLFGEKSPYIIATILSIIALATISYAENDIAIFISGFFLFTILGFLGSGCFYVSMILIKSTSYLARIVGTGYALGILFQFLNNNLLHEVCYEIDVVYLFFIFFIALIYQFEKEITCPQPSQKADINNIKSQGFVEEKSNLSLNIAILLILTIICMTCIFSIMDSSVTILHVRGSLELEKWPRIILALSALISGFLFDIKNRQHAAIIMYSVMMLSTLCIVILKLTDAFVSGLIIFYFSAGFFAVFFTASFMELSTYMKAPEFWAGLGRAINNLTAAIIAIPCITILQSWDILPLIVGSLFLFVAVSYLSFTYTIKRLKLIREIEEVKEAMIEKEKKIEAISEKYHFTQREKETFGYLVSTEDNIQIIADKLYISRRTLERYITSIYKKTNTKSRVGLIKIYNAC